MYETKILEFLLCIFHEVSILHFVSISHKVDIEKKLLKSKPSGIRELPIFICKLMDNMFHYVYTFYVTIHLYTDYKLRHYLYDTSYHTYH